MPAPPLKSLPPRPECGADAAAPWVPCGADSGAGDAVQAPTPTFAPVLLGSPCATPREPAPGAGPPPLGAFPRSLLSLTQVKALRLPPVPACLLCPIGRQLMEDPVVASDGVTYERRNIEALLQGGRRATSPVSGEPFPSAEVEANAALKEAIAAYVALRQHAEQQWKELEVDVGVYVRQTGEKMRESEGQVHSLLCKVAALEGGHSARGGASGRTATDSTAASPPPAAEAPVVPPLAVPEKACPWSAGPAPRSARRERSATPTPRASPTPRGGPGGGGGLSGLRALTPRLAQMVWTPRGGQRS